MRQATLPQTCVMLLAIAALPGCNKETAAPTASTPAAPAATPAPTPPPAPTPLPAPPTKAHAAEAPPPTPAAAPDGTREEEATVLRMQKLRGGRGTSYEAQVGLADGTRFAFLPLKNRLALGSKVMVRYVVQDGARTRPELPVAIPLDSYTISAQVLPMLKPTPVGDGTFVITFPGAPDESKTDLGVLYRYAYKFSKSYYPDTYYFFRTSAEGNGSRAFFKDQATSLLALTGGKRLAVRINQVAVDRKTRLKRASGRLTIYIGYSPKDGAIQLWFDARKKVIYGAWVLAYSPNQLASNADMRKAFFDSFTLKP